MKTHPLKDLLRVAILATGLLQSASAQFAGWQHSGSIWIMTTPDGANLPPSTSENNFPALLRLSHEGFDFSQAKPHGEDLRFSGKDGKPLAYQIEEWDSSAGKASIWIRIPSVRGNDRQEIKMHWGKPNASSESNGAAVFNKSNSYLSVWHMSDPVKDEVGTVNSKDEGTTTITGMVGKARHFAGNQGISAGEDITQYPSGTGPMTTEAWFQAEKPNTTIVAWGKEQRPGKVMMNFLSPPRIAIQCYFADVEADTSLQVKQWYHVVHTYQNKDSRVYINGKLEGATHPELNIPKTSALWIGGWYNNYKFIGDIDEVRISNVVRSPDWIKLQYENQKPQQTLVGPIVQRGNDFEVSQPKIDLLEGSSTTITARAGGAIKLYWILKSNGTETTIATDQLSCKIDAGRVTGDQTATLCFKAVFPSGAKTKEIPMRIRENIADPEFTLKAPTTWNGRTSIEIVPQITNLAKLPSDGGNTLKTEWSVSGIAITKEEANGNLILTRAQNSGNATVTATLSNGGQPVTKTVTLQVTEPKSDPWIARTPEENEQPEDNQFYARDDKNEGTLIYNGVLTEPADSVFIKVYADGKPYQGQSIKVGANKSYAFTLKLKPGLIHYQVEFGTKSGNRETIIRKVNNLICGDVYVIDGQSNALSTDWGKGEFPETNEWIRSFGSTGGDPSSIRWGNAIRRTKGDLLAIGFWGFELAKHLLETQKIPICIINGAVGGTRIDLHQRNSENPEDLETIYGRLLWRVKQAKLTHGIRGLFWHQGENDQGADGPAGGFGWETYQNYFVELSAAWKDDFPNIQHYYLFQIWPKSCAMGINGSDNRLREVQRQLPRLFSNMSIMSTLGIEPAGGCHYPPEGYVNLARLISPLVDQYQYGITPPNPITPPDLKACRFTSPRRDEIMLEFDQPVKWNNTLTSQFYLDGEKDKIASGASHGNTVTLKLKAASAAQNITYIDGNSWSQRTLLRGENGIAALTFCEVPIAAWK